MDWTNSLDDAAAVDRQAYIQDLIRNRPSVGYVAAPAVGLADFLSMGKLDGVAPAASNFRNEYPISYNAGKWSPLAALAWAGVPAGMLAVGMGAPTMSGIFHDPNVQRLYNDHIAKNALSGEVKKPTDNGAYVPPPPPGPKEWEDQRVARETLSQTMARLNAQKQEHMAEREFYHGPDANKTGLIPNGLSGLRRAMSGAANMYDSRNVMPSRHGIPFPPDPSKP